MANKIKQLLSRHRKFVVIGLAAIAWVTYTTRQSGDDSLIDSTFLRNLALDVERACDDYFAALPSFALSDRGEEATRELGVSLDAAIQAIADINSAVSMKYVESEASDSSSAEEAIGIVRTIGQFPQLSDSDKQQFLSVTVKEQCNKWPRITDLTDTGINQLFSD
jgi:hypothetical protein